jgi:hypothetical protein
MAGSVFVAGITVILGFQKPFVLAFASFIVGK